MIGSMTPMEPLLHALRKKYSDYAAHWPELALLAKYGSQASVEPLLALLGDSNVAICENAAEALYQTHPEIFAEVARQAEAILRGEPTGEVFASRVQSRIAGISHSSSSP
jgi:HEAT repeat protein